MRIQIALGGGGVSLLGLLFVTLKLCEVINWSWWLVTLPFWLPLIIAATVIGVMLMFFAAWLKT